MSTQSDIEKAARANYKVREALMKAAGSDHGSISNAAYKITHQSSTVKLHEVRRVARWKGFKT